ncbi:MAG: cell envelope biogenesis protein OmpA [Flavobacteriaceae bacterium]
MKNTLTYKVAFGCCMIFFCYSLSAQRTKNNNVYETNTRLDHYQELKGLGYTDSEVFEDLGNANFLSKNYSTALFWYKKLKRISTNNTLASSYQERYHFAEIKTTTAHVSNVLDDKDWLTMVKADYQTKVRPIENTAAPYTQLNFKDKIDQLLVDQGLVENDLEFTNSEAFTNQNTYKAPIALTADGNTAYFSKAVYLKPKVGVFSKKELVHKIYKADKINGQWKNIRQIALCPKHYSSLHPTVSNDGKRLFFASNMPGTFGEYDIYTSTIYSDGSIGVAKNLGTKVNTDKNDLYPNIVGSNTLFFASEGRKGHGGLDIYRVQVDRKKVGLAVNLGSPINSMEDDFSIRFTTKKGTGYVMSNRGKKKGTIQKVVFSYLDKRKSILEERREYNLLEAFQTDSKINYSTTTFKDE